MKNFIDTYSTTINGGAGFEENKKDIMEKLKYILDNGFANIKYLKSYKRKEIINKIKDM